MNQQEAQELLASSRVMKFRGHMYRKLDAAQIRNDARAAERKEMQALQQRRGAESVETWWNHQEKQQQQEPRPRKDKTPLPEGTRVAITVPRVPARRDAAPPSLSLTMEPHTAAELFTPILCQPLGDTDVGAVPATPAVTDTAAPDCDAPIASTAPAPPVARGTMAPPPLLAQSTDPLVEIAIQQPVRPSVAVGAVTAAVAVATEATRSTFKLWTPGWRPVTTTSDVKRDDGDDEAPQPLWERINGSLFAAQMPCRCKDTEAELGETRRLLAEEKVRSKAAEDEVQRLRALIKHLSELALPVVASSAGNSDDRAPSALL